MGSLVTRSCFSVLLLIAEWLQPSVFVKPCMSTHKAFVITSIVRHLVVTDLIFCFQGFRTHPTIHNQEAIVGLTSTCGVGSCHPNTISQHSQPQRQLKASVFNVSFRFSISTCALPCGYEFLKVLTFIDDSSRVPIPSSYATHLVGRTGFGWTG